MNRHAAVFMIAMLAGCSGSEPPPGFLSRETLESLPHVESVDVTRAKGMPPRQIIHILNWHFVERPDFEADLHAVAGKPLTDPENEREWQAFLDEVESLLKQQEALLRKLVASHGIKAVYLEGLASSDVEGYRSPAARLKNWKKPAGDDTMSEFLRQQYRQDSLLLGAASRVEGLQIRGAEDPDAMNAANPVKDGTVEFDAEASERRESAIVQNVLTDGSPVVVLVLGGGHDLSDNVPAGVEVVRIGVRAYQAVSGE